MYTLNPKAGEKVRIRLPDGKAVDARYSTKHPSKTKAHTVYLNAEMFCACGEKPEYKPYFTVDTVRFIYPLELMPAPEEVREK